MLSINASSRIYLTSVNYFGRPHFGKSSGLRFILGCAFPFSQWHFAPSSPFTAAGLLWIFTKFLVRWHCHTEWSTQSFYYISFFAVTQQEAPPLGELLISF